MLISIKDVHGYKLSGTDGEVGTVKDFYFDDQFWTIRYLVSDTGHWLSGRKVLIAPYALGTVNQRDESVAIDLTKSQIEGSPSLDSDKPVSRQFEDAYYGYYGWPTYWSGQNRWGTYPYILRGSEKWRTAPQDGKSWDPHLRSIGEVTGYHIQAAVGEIGHVADFIVDDETWTIRYLVVDTRNWWPGRKVLVSPLWIERVSWNESKVFVSLTRETIKTSPEYTDPSSINRDYETRLHHHYNRRGYWVADQAVGELVH